MGEKKCTWKFDKWDDYYSTTCGNTFCFVDDKGLKNRSFKICPYCGKKIKEA